MTSENELRALNHLRRIIQLGHYPDGSKLPTERELASELSIGRGPVRRALAKLEAEGRISRHVGQGTYVGARPMSVQPEASILLMNTASPGDIMESRMTLEPRLAALAAVRAAEEDITYLKLCNSKSEAADTWASWERWDATFHRTIALSARNTMLAEIIDLINKARRARYGVQLHASQNATEWRTRLVRQHRDIVEAIANRNPQDAARAMRNHLQSVEERIFGDPDELIEYTEGL